MPASLKVQAFRRPLNHKPCLLAWSLGRPPLFDPLLLDSTPNSSGFWACDGATGKAAGRAIRLQAARRRSEELHTGAIGRDGAPAEPGRLRGEAQGAGGAE